MGDDDRAGAGGAFALDLTGDLPCGVCGYNLRGLSIRSACPECGTAVRATLLAKVDPKAEELVPLRRPRLLVLGLVAWAWGGFAAAALAWAGFAGEQLDRLPAGAVGAFFGGAPRVSVWALAVSAGGALALLRPTRDTPARDGARAAVAVAAMVLLVLVHREIMLGDGGVGGHLASPAPTAGFVLIATVAYGLRANLRRLADRSLVLRTGRVDRQPMGPVIGAAGVGASGSVVLLLRAAIPGIVGDASGIVGAALLGAGGFLLTIMLGGLAVDAWRVGGVLLAPAPGLTDVMGHGRDD